MDLDIPLEDLLSTEEFLKDVRLAAALDEQQLQEFIKFLQAPGMALPREKDLKELESRLGQTRDSLRSAWASLTAVGASPEYRRDPQSALAALNAGSHLEPTEAAALAKHVRAIEAAGMIRLPARRLVSVLENSESFMEIGAPRLSGAQARVLMSVDPNTLETDSIEVLPIAEIEFTIRANGSETALPLVQTDADLLGELVEYLDGVKRVLDSMRDRVRQGARVVPVETEAE